MAGDWVPVRTDLASTREVLEIAAATGLDRFHVSGLLVAFWSWFQSQSESGHLSLKSPDKILPQVVGGSREFWKAVEKTGWIYQDSDGFGIPNPDRWNGTTTKARLGEVLRKRIHRAKKKAETPAAIVPDLSGHPPEVIGTCPTPQNTEDSIQKDNILPAAPPKTKEKPKRQPDPMFEALAEVCRIDWHLCTEDQRGELNQSVGILRGEGHTPAEITVFGRWWYQGDWRGKKGQAPTPSQVRDTWQNAFVTAGTKRKAVIPG